jgi:hypothetical protein
MEPIVFKSNYLEEIPEDIVESILKYSREDDYDIYVKIERDSYSRHSWRYDNFIDDRTHKRICKLRYVFKAGENTYDFINREKIASAKLKNHIDDIIRYMKMPKVKKILRNNGIYNAKKIYEQNNQGMPEISNYEKALLSQYIFSAYYTSVCVRKIDR